MLETTNQAQLGGTMALLETALTVDQILEGMRQLSVDDQRTLAAAVLADRKLEPFIEELEDSLACEEAAREGPAHSFTVGELSRQ
jgi:hypothetical protein